MDLEPVRNNPTANELDAASWMWYPTRPAKASAQSCKFVNESFSQWMIRQTSRDGFENMAPYVDRSAVKKYAQIAATYLKVPRTYATFTWSNVRNILNYPFSSSFAFKALHGHGMSWLMIDGKMYESGTLRPSTGPRLDPGFLKRQAVKWMKQCYHCNDERQYAMVRRGVILEEILGGGFATEMRVYMFHGEPYLLEIREHVPTDFGKVKEHFSIINNGDDPLEPANIQLEHSKAYISNSTMRDVFRASRDLTRNFRFVSVHFYYVKSTLYFKELDFSPEGTQWCCVPVTVDSASWSGSGIDSGPVFTGLLLPCFRLALDVLCPFREKSGARIPGDG
eukprot:scaffold694_cov338-Pavlova_lutheri.AAC.9